MRPIAQIAVALVLAPALAHADVPPPDECGKPDTECSTAPPDYASPGICKASTCSRRSPDGENTQYVCNVCVPSGAKKEGKKSRGCSASTSPTERSSTPWVVFAALVVLGRRRAAARDRPAQPSLSDT